MSRPVFVQPRRAAMLAAVCAVALALGGCDDDAFDPASQIGPNPNLPEPQQYLFPPMHLSSVVGWKTGEKPTVAAGLKVEALATGLQHPRSVYLLPNGDVLVVESKAPPAPPISRPKDLVMQWMEAKTTSTDQKSNRITLVRNGDDEGGPVRTTFLDNLSSPFGVALVGNSYFGQHVDARVQPQRPDLVAKAIVPDYALSSHVAPLGLAFDTGSGLPDRYRGGAFVGEHGSWDRPQFNGYKVVFVPFTNGHPSGKAQDVVTGFLDSDGHARGRPVGVAFDKSGALLIADDVGNTVWRVSSQ